MLPNLQYVAIPMNTSQDLYTRFEHCNVFAPTPVVASEIVHQASEIVHQDALAYLNSVRAWARLFHVSASGA